MVNKEDLQKLKKVIQATNHWIIEPQLGCIVYFKPNKESLIFKGTIVSREGKDYSRIHYFDAQRNSCCEIFPKSQIESIEGRPIIWDDVAKTINKDIEQSQRIEIKITGEIQGWRGGGNVPIYHWKLGEDLDNQFEETVNWLIDLLVKREL